MRLYSTADDRGLYLNRLFVCLSVNCSRDGYVPSQFFVTKKLSHLSLLSLLSLLFFLSFFVSQEVVIWL
ncbi:MAG: hypothetical protein LBP59_20610 [Planctomycetaceae bacterium]|nr:hypothetical protein [Planctomycetaceae bacterium]